jgi:TPP-dependent pyruvate/acetoin dehydrogenase alpha subunit
MEWTPDRLIGFTERVKAAFLAKQILAPVHLNSSTQAEPLIEIFKSIRPQDYVFSNWRGTWHALLKGVPEEDVFQAILEGRSMYLCFNEQRFLAGSIVAGMLPMALGVALGIKKKGLDERVHVMIGDMSARCGLFFEFVQYWKGHDLPISVVIENNGLSTDTDTEAVWGCKTFDLPSNGIYEYKYERTTGHVGVGTHVSFF